MDHEKAALALQYLDDGADLAHYAAHAAAKMLVDNWTAADEIFSHDIDGTIDALRAFQKRLTSRATG